MIDGLIILDDTGRPIIQTNFSGHSAAYPLVHIDAINDAVSKSSTGTGGAELEPVLYVTTHEGPAFCCHEQRGDLRILCPVSRDIDPTFVFAFMDTFVEILEEYFGEISAMILKDHFDTVYQLLGEMLDNGYPLTTEKNALQDIVIPPSLMTRILSVAGMSGVAKASAKPFASPIPWRKANVRYNANEIYFDVIEEMKAIADRNGKVLSSFVRGRIESNCRLSGTPDLSLSFVNPEVLQDCAFHSCIRLQRWTRDKTLSFVPPDGRFTLMDYHFVPISTSAAVTAPTVPIPFSLRSLVNVTENGGTIEFTLTSRLSVKLMENTVVALALGDSATGANCSVSSGATWGFDPKTKTLHWEIAKVPQGSSHTLRGSFTSSQSKPRITRAVRITFEVNQYNFSNLKVGQLKVAAEGYKPYKGVRGRSSGDIEWRL